MIKRGRIREEQRSIIISLSLAIAIVCVVDLVVSSFSYWFSKVTGLLITWRFLLLVFA